MQKLVVEKMQTEIRCPNCDNVQGFTIFNVQENSEGIIEWQMPMHSPNPFTAPCANWIRCEATPDIRAIATTVQNIRKEYEDAEMDLHFEKLLLEERGA
jgi:hypothetical protein